MRLLLTSAGITNKSIAKVLKDLMPKPFKESKLVFIPTAANPERGDKDWLIADFNNLYQLGFKEMDIVDISALTRKQWEPPIKSADVLVFGGGNTFHLTYWLKKSGLKQLLPELLKRKVYVGISAGSICATRNLMLSQSRRLYYEDIGKTKEEKGLGLVNFQVRPHLNSPHFPKVRVRNLTEIAKKTGATFYALDDNSAIKIHGQKKEVVSEGKWKKFN